MLMIHCPGSSISSSTDSLNKKRFSLSRSFSFGDAFSTKNIRRVSSFFKKKGSKGSAHSALTPETRESSEDDSTYSTSGRPPTPHLLSKETWSRWRRSSIRSSRSRRSSSCGSVRLSDFEMVLPPSQRQRRPPTPQPTTSSDENSDRSSRASWTYDPTSRYVRVDGVDFEIVSGPSTNTVSRWSQSQEDYRGSPLPSPSAEDSRSPSPQPSIRRKLSVQSLVKICCSSRPIDSLEKQELRRKDSVGTQFKCFEAAWQAGHDLGTLHRPGSVYEEMMEVDQEIATLMKEQFYNLNPEHPLVLGDVFTPNLTKAVDGNTGDNVEN